MHYWINFPAKYIFSFFFIALEQVILQNVSPETKCKQK